MGVYETKRGRVCPILKKITKNINYFSPLEEVSLLESIFIKWIVGERRLGAILKNTFFGRSCTSGNYDKILIGDSGNKISSNHLPSRYKFEPLS